MYTRVFQQDDDGTWFGYFQEMPEYFTHGEVNTLASCDEWLTKLLADVQAAADDGFLPPLPTAHNTHEHYRHTVIKFYPFPADDVNTATWTG